jgi:aspartate aminotransferase
LRGRGPPPAALDRGGADYAGSPGISNPIHEGGGAMGISQLASSIAESPTLKLNEEARILREKGEAVVHLGIGEPKNKTPIGAVLGSAVRLTQGDVKYSPTDGLPSLKKAILRYTEESYDKRAAPENVIVSSGAKQSIYNVLYTLLNPQDEVILLAPYWVSYPEMVRMVYGVPVVVSPVDGSFQPRLEDIERAVGPATKAVICNSPNNPSGVVYPESFIQSLVEYCERRSLYLIMDDIYHKLVFDGCRTVSPYRFSSRDLDNSTLVVVNGVSKLYGMTGFRIGWVVASRKLVEVMTNVQAQTTSCSSIVLQAGAEGALNGLQSTVESLRLTMQNNRDVMIQELKTFPRVNVTRPSGTFYCLPDFSAYTRDSVELSKFLLKKALLVTVPGKEFGMEGHLRLSFAGTVKDITEGVARLRWALDPTAPTEIYMGDRKCVREWI